MADGGGHGIRRTSQPQNAAPIDRQNNLGRSVVYYQHGPLRDVFGALLTMAGTVAAAPTRRGLLYSFDTAGVANIESSVSVAPPFTAVADVYYSGSSSGAKTVIANGGSGAGGRGWGVSIASSSNTFRLTFGGVAAYSVSSGALAAGLNRIVVVVTGNGGSAIYYVNGILNSSRSVGTMGSPQSRGITIGAAHNGFSFVDPIQAANFVGNATVFNRALTDAEVLEEYANPWQIFEPDPLGIVYSIPSGGPITGSAALTGEGTLTATGRLIARSTGALSGTGALTADGTRTAKGAADLAGAGSLTAAGRVIARSAANLTGTGTLTADGDIVGGPVTGSAALAGVGTLTAAGRVVARGVAALAGAGTLSAVGRLTARATAAMTGVATLTATAVGTGPDIQWYRTGPNLSVTRRAARNPTLRR